MTTVALVYKTGGDYTLEYVSRITKALRKHGATKIKILSDDSRVRAYGEYVPLKHSLSGWWNKLELFYLTGKTIYFDLDVIINGDISALLNHDFDFAMLKGFKHGAVNSSVMAWNGDFSHLMTKFNKAIIPEYSHSISKWGDQAYIADHVGAKISVIQDVLSVVSRKYAPIEERQQASVICYHGKPRPHETGWAL